MISDHNPNSFRRGVMTLVLLALLEQQDMYGYQLVQEIALQSGGQLTTQEGSRYPVLYKCLQAYLDTVHGVLQIVKGGDSHAHSEP